MTSLLPRLFRNRPQSRRPAAVRPARRKTTLAVEPLDQRVVPTVSPGLSGGVLSLTGTSANDNISVSTSQQLVSIGLGGAVYKTNVNVSARFSDGTATKTWDAANVKSLYFFGGGGSDTFTNNTGIDAFYDGSGGTFATMIGGTGKNTFSTDGDDSIVPKGTQNQTYGLVNNATPAELAAQGSLSASLSNNHQTLTLSGPGGVGFKLAGNWVDDTSLGVDIFMANGNVTLKSALGDIPFVTGPTGLHIETSADQASGQGAVTNVSLTGLPNLNVNGTGPFASLSNELGLNVSLPNFSWGLQLGNTLGDLNLPLNPGVPYLYLKGDSGFSVSFGNASVSKPGKSLALAIDPADPSVAVRYGDFAVGGSAKGRIPFTPFTQPSGLTTPVYGNVFGAGSVQLGSYPITIGGNAVLDLDANNDGTLVGISGDTFKRLLAGSLKITDLAANAINDVAIGVNGNLSLSYDKAGFNFSLPVANATLVYQPGLVAFRGDQPDLFAGTPLASLLPAAAQNLTGPRYFVDGSIAWAGGVKDWHLTAGVDNLTLGGGFTATHAQIGVDNAGVHADASISGLLGLATIHARGDVLFDGSYDLTVHAGANFDAVATTAHAGFDFDLHHAAGSSTTSLGAHFTAWLDRTDIGIGDFYGNLDDWLTFTKDSSGLHVSGHGTASLTYDDYFTGDASVFPVGFDVSNSGFTVHTPSPLPDLSVSWNGVVFDDLNGDGQRETGEPGLSGYTVFLDQNNNGIRDRGEPTAVSDATGSYSFGQVPDGPFVARIVLPNKNVAQTNPFDSTVHDPSTGDNMQYHFGLHGVNAAGDRQLAATLRKQLSHQTAGIGFWAGKKGQALIASLNGGATDTQLSTWLTATLPNLYGANAGDHDLTGKTNADVAALFQKLVAGGQRLDAQVLATALSVYVTDSNLAGDAATAYGFRVTGGGAGSMGFNVGAYGSAAGVANNTVVSILDILRATDKLSADGGLTKVRGPASLLYAAILQAGGL
jgi:hypothetical protein